MRYTKSVTKSMFVMFLIVLFATTTLFTNMAFAVNHTEELIIPKNESSFTIDLVVDENKAYAGIEFGLTHSSGLEFTEYIPNETLDAQIINIEKKADTNYFGFFTSDNIYNGKQTVGKLKFTYTGDENQTIEITKMTVARIVDKEAVGTEKDSPAYTFLVKRQTTSNTGGGSGGSGKNPPKVDPPVEEPPVEEPPVEEPDKPKFTDVSGHWADKDISTAVEKGFVTGYPDGTFQPDDTVTRAEFITMLVRANKLEKSDKKLDFSDVTNHWALDNIIIATSNGFVSGYTDGTFKPNSVTTRQEVAKIVASLKGLSDTDDTEITLPFNDVKDISPWALPYVNQVYKAKIMIGDNNNFNPLANITRAQAVVTVLRCMN